MGRKHRYRFLTGVNIKYRRLSTPAKKGDDYQTIAINRTLSTHLDEDLNGYYFRMIIEITDSDITYPTDILESKNFLKFDINHWDRQSSLMGLQFMSTKGQYSEVIVNNKVFDFYTIEQIRAQIIDSCERTGIEQFKKDTRSIRSAFAFLSGKLYRTQVVYLASPNANFDTIHGVCYEAEPPSDVTTMDLINPRLYFEFLNKKLGDYEETHEQFRRMFPSESFSKLCTLIQEKHAVSKTIDLIIEGNRNLNSLQQGAIYSVAIETIANVVYEQHEEKINAIVDKKLASQIRDALKKTISSFSESLTPEQTSILENRINSIHQATNRNRLLKPFEILGLKLTEEEVSLLEHRNDFLHGKPLDNDSFEIKRISLEFHHLIGCLILKMVGYEGFVTNLAVRHLLENPIKLNNHVRNFDPDKIRSVEEIKAALEEKRFEGLEEILDNTLKAATAMAKLTSFVHII